ncbi:hypothetical protein HMPREF3038_00457 [Akkermansia sp. KLE1797]|nr:hypothetical protein HMPREF3038_00457 [Akkermansia sp. KLE1797]KXU55626.1 hypothetical protein HMPREF3039_00183 [Akkermansia sp. KLE1798]
MLHDDAQCSQQARHLHPGQTDRGSGAGRGGWRHGGTILAESCRKSTIFPQNRDEKAARRSVMDVDACSFSPA